ncbi:MAG: leucyl/phenylalanyl-tRNA--protein transferase [Bacteroidales bacterium]|nr:leucyl/phenylalanyl-tRNA--protein transferase [Bacteroidales bacterium]
MPDFRSPVFFPDPETADRDGLLACGGNLEVETLLAAYSQGIFPWYSEGSPILWWSPDPRLVLFPENYKASKSLLQTIKKNIFEIRFDNSFKQVIHHCARIERKGQTGTWITPEMQEAYIKLHEAGYAHSAETYCKKKLVGGLYGVSIGTAFFGESMFYLMRDASKVAFYYLVKRLYQWGFTLVDAQQSTKHLKSMGAEEIPRKQFLHYLKQALIDKSRTGKWKL